MQKNKITEQSEPSFELSLKTSLSIIAIFLVTYAVMAVITHFALNNSRDSYTFTDSLYAIFDSNTNIFRLVFGFGVFSLVVIFTAILLKSLKNKIL